MSQSTQRERDYIAAAAELYKDAGNVGQRTRVLAYEASMEQLAGKYPDDAEARIFYALALDQSHLPTDKSYAKLLKAGEILEREFARQPDHPGVAHYLIHTYDVPLLASRALDAAKRYARIAPDAPHALHMPSHIFTRVGYWQESIDTNIASAEAAEKANSPAEVLHALEYQTYAYLQTAQDTAAEKVADSVEAISKKMRVGTAGGAAPPPSGWFAVAAIPARYALERNDWARAANLTLHESPVPWVNAVTHFARALGAARSGEPEAAEADIRALHKLTDELKSAKDTYWASQVEIQAKGASAWLSFAKGKREEGIELMREAARLEDETEKAAVSPGPLKPARELLGEMLLEAGQPADALREFEATMGKEPNRFRGLYGAAIAAERMKDSVKAKRYAEKLLTICQHADPGARQELESVRRAAGA